MRAETLIILLTASTVCFNRRHDTRSPQWMLQLRITYIISTHAFQPDVERACGTPNVLPLTLSNRCPFRPRHWTSHEHVLD